MFESYIRTLMFFLACAGVGTATTTAQVPVDELLLDVTAIDTGGNPASMLVWGEAHPLIVSPDGVIFAAAGALGEGRIAVLGHGGFTNTNNVDSEIFVANIIEWLAEPAHSRAPQQSIRLFGATKELVHELQRRNITFVDVTGDIATIDLNTIDVVLHSPQAFAKAGRFDEVAQWLHDGGSMLIAETAWGVLHLNPALTLDTLAANRLLTGSGIRFTDGAHSGFSDDGVYAVHRELLEAANADRALRILDGTESGDAAFAARIVGRAFAGLPLDSDFVATADRIADANRTMLNETYAAMSTTRLTGQTAPLARALIDLDSRRAMTLPPRDIDAHPSSIAFPGNVGPERVAHAIIELDPATPGWRSTGMYAPPGEAVTIVFAEQLADKGLCIQIGTWRDPHDHEYRVRLKNALRRYDVKATTTEVASAIGGPILIDLPLSLRDVSHAPILVEIHHAASAPYYKHGVTDLDAWREVIRHYDVPWAEMESDDLVFTVPSSAIRTVDRPDLIMQHWTRVHEAMQSLEPRTANHWADRQYRYVADVSVSWGYMYCPADAPIVIPHSAAAAMFDLDNFDAEGPNHLWGHYHEMGHAHQNPLWTDGATGEVTVNIFTVYALHIVNDYPLDSDVMRSTPHEAYATFIKQRESGKRFEEVGGPFSRLQLYALLWHEFGFDAFHATFDSIRALAKDEQPRDQNAERNVFLVHFGRAVERNICSFFEQWGIEVADESRAALAAFPEWLPTAPQE
ncbi:MAG: M60 family metallopeptidase [Phycisphaerales bacterium]